MCPISQPSPTLWAANTRAANPEPVLPFDGPGIGAAVMEHYRACSTGAVFLCLHDRPRRRYADMDRTHRYRRVVRQVRQRARIQSHRFFPELDLGHKGASRRAFAGSTSARRRRGMPDQRGHLRMGASGRRHYLDLKPDMCGAIETPTLLFQPGRDVWVLNGPQDDFVERVREAADQRKYGTASRCTRSSHAEHGGRTVCEQVLDFPSARRGL